MQSYKPFAVLVAAMVFFFLCSTSCFAQNKEDSIPKKISVKHSPKKATILSACLPGLGQAYNHKYWKIPIFYAGIGTFGYFAYYTNGLYWNYKNEYVYRVNNPTGINSFPEYSSDQLQVKVDTYRRYRDLSLILMAAMYTLNLVDANVDAHMFTFDVSNNLSLLVAPRLGYSSFTGRQTTELVFELKF